MVTIGKNEFATGAKAALYSEAEFQEATFSFVKYYVQSRHYDELLAENAKLKKDLDAEIAWRTRVSGCLDRMGR